MRRSFAGLLFGIAFAFASLAISGFLLQRTAFSPERTASAADAVLQDEALQQELVRLVSEATANQMYPGDPAAASVVRTNVGIVASTAPGAELLAELVADAHAVLIGQSEDQVTLTPQQVVQVVRDERAMALPAITFDVPRVGTLAFIDGLLGWLVPLSAIAAVVFFVLCFFAHPERSAMFHSLGIGLVALAALTILFAYVLPKFVPPALSDSVWARIPPQLADNALGRTLFGALLLAGAGLGLFAASGRMGRSKRWSTPVSTYRYREERRWG